MIKRIRCVIIAVKNFEEAVDRFSKVLDIPPKLINYQTEGIKSASFPIGDSAIELITPVRPGIPVEKFLNTRGEGIFGISLQVTNVEEDMKTLKAKGVTLLSDKPMTDELGLKYVWSHPKALYGVEFEFSQPE